MPNASRAFAECLYKEEVSIRLALARGALLISVIGPYCLVPGTAEDANLARGESSMHLKQCLNSHTQPRNNIGLGQAECAGKGPFQMQRIKGDGFEPQPAAQPTLGNKLADGQAQGAVGYGVKPGWCPVTGGIPHLLNVFISDLDEDTEAPSLQMTPAGWLC